MLKALEAGETSLTYDAVISRVEMPDFQKLYDELTAIQWGEKPDPFGWIVPIPKN